MHLINNIQINWSGIPIQIETCNYILQIQSLR